MNIRYRFFGVVQLPNNLGAVPGTGCKTLRYKSVLHKNKDISFYILSHFLKKDKNEFDFYPAFNFKDKTIFSIIKIRIK